MNHDDDTCPHLVRANLLETENARLKAEVERLKSLCDKLGMGGKHTITAITEENALLKAEVDRLADENARLTMMKDACKRMIKRRDKWIWEKRAELERLRASSFVTAVPVEQYERLTKAGDAVCESPYLWETDPAVIAWRAAKEGKQP